MSRWRSEDIRANARTILGRDGLQAAAAWIAAQYARQNRPAFGFSWSEGHPSTRDAEILLTQGHVEHALTSLLCDPPAPDDQDLFTAAATQRQMEQLLRSRSIIGADMLGFAVLAGGRPCSICGTEQVRITWTDYDAGRAPTLPRHPGCTCCFLPWLL